MIDQKALSNLTNAELLAAFLEAESEIERGGRDPWPFAAVARFRRLQEEMTRRREAC